MIQSHQEGRKQDSEVRATPTTKKRPKAAREHRWSDGSIVVFFPAEPKQTASDSFSHCTAGSGMSVETYLPSAGSILPMDIFLETAVKAYTGENPLDELP